ncbi:MAG: patatin-like phospholipase family protein [Candidatus Doudnabacteria bacterium]
MSEIARKQKKIALAMAGAGARAVMYFGILDVFKEHGIEISMFSTCSSSTFVALAYSSGTSEKLKQRVLNMDGKELLSLFDTSFNGGVFSFDKVETEMRKYVPYTNLEEMPIPVSIAASDIVHGEEVIFSMGDISRAVRASCSMPGLFEPVIWGGRVLLDGGLFNIIPVEAAKASNPDIIIGIDLASSRNLFSNKVLNLKRGWNVFFWPLSVLKKKLIKLQRKLRGENYLQPNIDDIKMPNLFSILDRSMNYAIEERRKAEYFNCDIVITPSVKGFGDVGIKKGEAMYIEGRRAAEEAIPAIKKLLQR